MFKFFYLRRGVAMSAQRNLNVFNRAYNGKNYKSNRKNYAMSVGRVTAQ